MNLRSARIAALALAAVLLAAGVALAAGPFASDTSWVPLVVRPPSNTLPLPAPDEASARLNVPSGFAVRIYAQGLATPRLMTVGPDGMLYVAERGAGRIVRLPDANDDGLADQAVVVMDGMNGPHNAEWFEGALYVAENDKITRLRDTNGDGDFRDAGEKTTITTNIPSGGGHSSRTLHFGPDGKLYVAAGSATNNSPEADKRRASIMRFNPDGSIPADNPFAGDPEETRRPVWAEGLRNSVDFTFMPDGRLLADHNGSDGLGDNAPPEEIVIDVERGKHYGWPSCYTPTLGVTPAGTQEVRDTRLAVQPPLSSCADAVPALFTDLAHQAPLGMLHYTATLFPEPYQNNLFVAYHGSWNSGVPRDCKVRMIAMENGLPTGASDFLTGFRDSPAQSCGSAWGRPAGVAVGAKGELFVSDDKNGMVYRIIYIGE